MTIIVIGAGGFLGSSIVSHLRKRGGRVFTLSYRPEHQREFLAAFEALLIDEEPHAVINAGASQNGKDDPAALEDLVASNIFLPAALASLIRTHSPATCLVTFGTSWQIGEKGEPAPFNAYAASKTASEAFLDHFAQDGIRVASLRLYDTYGPGDKRNKIVNLIADALITGKELPMSPGGQMIDIVYISDVLTAIDVTISHLRGESRGSHCIYAVRSGRPVTIMELLDVMRTIAGVETASFIKPGIYPYRARERFFLYPDTVAPPGWAPQISLKEGVRLVLEDRRARIANVVERKNEF